MSLPNLKRSSITLNDFRVKKRARHASDDEGIAAQESSTVQPLEPGHVRANPILLDDTSSPLPEILEDHRQPPYSQHPKSEYQAETGRSRVAAASVARASTPPEAYDICFGMLMVKATCTQNNELPQECTPVEIDFEGRLLRVREENSNRQIALVVSNALSRLVNEFSVTLTANICGKKPPIVYTSNKKGQTASEMDIVKFCSLRVVVYGFLLQKDNISAILAQEELFLQHPGKTEFDRNVKYLNPHYLLPPGQNMLEVERLTTYECCLRWSSHSRELQTSMSEHQQSQILQIFNTASQPNCDLETIETSPRLVTKLKSHQVEALVMMIEKEAGIYDNAKFPAVWVPHKSPKGDISLPLSEAMTKNASKPVPPPSAKVQALIRNITRADKTPGSGVKQPKSVVFSFWTKMLDLVGHALSSQGFRFQRIDGQSSISQRKIALETFGSDPECSVMLASIGAAGEGIDLTSASAVHIVEPHWNPMAEAQAVDRVHRIGQQRDVEVIRYIANDSIEQYVQWMQRDKQRLIAESLSISEEKLQDVNEVRWKKLIEFLE
ncbi:uncharacterized protein FMAN_05219 [Fusarium mangiferae]|uniref:Helicase C-terminal domain-containing protein n=1 Tax=Fusarium mangiferae TaxID=192010 RepID=A0A1L7UCS0_FUSMA|nr:uncharacterized protein FMAN_05219 [Fusarium mangiferae]CVL08518.1 uncharacterized protein FMAN_05219 [Fusarium mangiferae]